MRNWLRSAKPADAKSGANDANTSDATERFDGAKLSHVGAPATAKTRVLVGTALVGFVLLVAAASFALTAHGLFGYGEAVAKLGALSFVIPVAVDALSLTGIAAGFALAHAPLRVRAYAWVVFGVGALASIFGQLADAQARNLPWQGWVGSAFWPVGLAMASHLAIVVWRWRVVVRPTSSGVITKATGIPAPVIQRPVYADGRTTLPIVPLTPVELPAAPEPSETERLAERIEELAQVTARLVTQVSERSERRLRSVPDRPTAAQTVPDRPRTSQDSDETATDAPGQVPADAQTVARQLAANGKTPGAIWTSWGRPARPTRKTVENWTKDFRTVTSQNGNHGGGERVASI